jgi:hypothetical protein
LRQTGKEDAFELAQIADSHWGDGVFEVKARKLGGVDGFQIQFQAEEEGQQRVWNLGGWGNTKIALQGIFGEPQMPGKIESGRWYSIRIELAGPRVRGYLDGKLVQEVVRPSPPRIYAVASRTQDGKELILKLVNAGAVPRKTAIDLQGLGPVAADRPGDRDDHHGWERREFIRAAPSRGPGRVGGDRPREDFARIPASPLDHDVEDFCRSLDSRTPSATNPTQLVRSPFVAIVLLLSGLQ